MTARRIIRAAVCLAMAGALPFAAPPGARAQTYETGGVQLTLGVGLRLAGDDNRALAATPAGGSFETAVPLSFALLSETPAARLALTFGAVLRDLDTPGPEAGRGVETPSVDLSYDRASAGARFAFDASLRDTDLSRGDVLSEDGLNVISGDATRRNATLGASLDWRDDAPLGFGVSARISDIAYRGGVARGLGGAVLNDSRRRSLRAGLRADLTPVTRLDLGLGWSDYRVAGTPGRRETLSFDGLLTVDRPLGAVSAALDITETPRDPRIAASLGRSLALPAGDLTARLGVSRGAGGAVFATGALDLQRDLPRATLNLGIARRLAESDDTDTERLSTRLTLGYLRDLTPLSRLRLGLSLAEVEETATGARARTGTLDAVYTRELNRDWGLDLGYRHRYSRQGGAAPARSNAVFLELRRDVVTRF